MKIERWIEVSLQKEGIHSYPAALQREDLKDVSFLGYPHRHIFYIYVRLEVFHEDRDVEFILFKNEVKNLLDEMGSDFDYKSCEMIGEDIINWIRSVYPSRKCEVRVYEDNENGAVLQYA